MKKLITTIALIFVACITNAQDNLTIKMALKVEGLPPEYAGMAESEIVSYIKGNKSKEEQIGMMGTSITINDGKITTALVEQMGEKTGWTATKEELEATSAKEKDQNKPKIEYLTDKKTIAGYECTKAIITVVGKDKKETKVTVWFTEKLKTNESKNRRSLNLNFGDLKGRPLEIETAMNQQGMELKIFVTTTEISTTSIDDSVFKVDTTGYKMITYKEVLEKMKAAEASEK
jgi:hypothetical protein